MASEDERFELVGGKFTEEPYGIAMKKGSSDDFVKAVNDALAELKSNGKYDEIHDKWIEK